MNRPSDFLALLSAIVAFGGLAVTAGFQGYLTTLFGTHAGQVTAGIGLLSGIAGIAVVALRNQSNPSPPPGQEHVTQPVGAPAPAPPA